MESKVFIFKGKMCKIEKAKRSFMKPYLFLLNSRENAFFYKKNSYSFVLGKRVTVLKLKFMCCCLHQVDLVEQNVAIFTYKRGIGMNVLYLSYKHFV